MKMQNYSECQKYGREAAFLANLILTQHCNAAYKLRGLLILLKGGYECRVGQFNRNILIINGKRFGWEVLESPGIVEQWLDQATPISG
mgnify:CR=1 FL=1